MKKMIQDRSQLEKILTIPESFDETCNISISPDSVAAIKNGSLKVNIQNFSGEDCLSNVNILICASRGVLHLRVGDDGAAILIGQEVHGNFDLRTWRNSKIKIGDRTTSNGIFAVCDNSSIECGVDCMFSSGVTLQSSDQHGIVDIKTGEIINQTHKKIMLGDHVWLGRNSSILYGADIQSGSIIGFGSFVNSEIPRNCMAAGSPARVVREDVTWCRKNIKLDDYSREEVNRRKSKTS